MNAAELIRQSRKAACLTQSELARRANTTQPAIAAYESGGKTPGIATLERLLDACDHELKLVATPRMRRGAASLSQIAEAIRGEIGKGTGRRDGESPCDRGDSPCDRGDSPADRDPLRLLFGFADDFRGSSRPAKIALIAAEPPLTGDNRFDAALAGVAELFAREASIATPAWVHASTRFVEPWWFVSSKPAFDAYVLAHTPAVFARHGVFLAREVFDRV